VPLLVVSLGLSIALPALVAGGAALALRKIRGGAAIACGLGFIAAWASVRGWPTLPPHDTTQWLPILAALAVALGIGESALRVGAGLRWALRAVFVAIVLASQIAPLFHSTWTPAIGAMWTSGFAVLWLATWLCLEQLILRTGGSWGAFILMSLGALSSVACGLSSSAALAQAGGMLTSAFGALWVVTRLHRNFDWKTSVLPVAAILLPAILVDAGGYAELRPITGSLLFAAPAGGWLAAHVFRKSPHRDWLAAAVAILLGAGAVVAAVVTSSPGGLE